MNTLIDEDLQISFDAYLADCKQYWNTTNVDTYETFYEAFYETFYEGAKCVIEDYILWTTDREKWMEETDSDT